jgi:hypothetical protein
MAFAGPHVDVEEPDDWTEAIDHASAPAVQACAPDRRHNGSTGCRRMNVIEGTGQPPDAPAT